MKRAHDTITYFETIDPLTDRENFACTVAGRNQSLGMRNGILVANHRDIPEVQGHGMNANQHLATLRLGHDLVVLMQVIDAREVV
ncbi:hypothetical protein D3C71_2054240 [compost metagenome]